MKTYRWFAIFPLFFLSSFAHASGEFRSEKVLTIGATAHFLKPQYLDPETGNVLPLGITNDFGSFERVPRDLCGKLMNRPIDEIAATGSEVNLLPIGKTSAFYDKATGGVTRRVSNGFDRVLEYVTCVLTHQEFPVISDGMNDDGIRVTYLRPRILIDQKELSFGLIGLNSDEYEAFCRMLGLGPIHRVETEYGAIDLSSTVVPTLSTHYYPDAIWFRLRSRSYTEGAPASVVQEITCDKR